ncbi:MAG: glycosyl hydrolase-related protein [Planctomycetota bacterium]
MTAAPSQPAEDRSDTGRPARVFVVPFSHLDLLWLGNREECINRGCRVFQEAVRLCESDPAFRFMIEDGVFLEQFLRLRPQWADRLLVLIREGRIEPPGKWCTITQTNVHGEVLARNFLYGIRETEAWCGRRPRSLHLGDLPAHPASLPQIMRSAGFDSLVISRGGPMNQPLFRWQSPAGPGQTEVVCWHAPYCYNWGLPLGESPAQFEQQYENELAEQVAVMVEKSASHVFMHYGWDLSVPTDDAPENLRRWNRNHTTQMQWATQEEYFDAIHGDNELPVFTGEMPTVWGNWPDPAYLDVTIHHDEAQSALLLAERLCALALARGDRPSATTLERHWKLLLESLDHNYSAVATEETHARKNRLTHGVTEAASRHAAHHLSRIAAAVPRSDGEIPVVVFNPSSFERSELVRGRVILYGHAQALTPENRKTFHLVDAYGRSVPFEIIDHRVSAADQVEVLVAAQEVPPLGYKTYYARYGKADKASNGQEPIGSYAPALNLDVDPVTSEIRVQDRAGTTLLTFSLRAVEQDPRNQIMQLTETGRLFPLLALEQELSVNSDLRTVKCIRGVIADTPVELAFSMNHWSGWIEVDATIDHKGTGYLRHQLLLTPAGGVDPGSRIIGNPFGSNRFDSVVPDCAPAREDEVTSESYGRTREAQGWFLMRGFEQDRGIAVATTRRLIEHREGGIAVNLLSSMSAKWIKPARVFHPFAGRYKSSLRIALVEPGDRTAATRLAESLWMPMQLTCDYGDGGVPEASHMAAALKLEPDHVVLSAFKIADDGDGLIVRLVETAGRACVAKARIAGLEGPVYENNLIEATGNTVHPDAIPFAPFEIKTLRFTGPRVAVNRFE